jgi:hypothetical protein
MTRGALIFASLAMLAVCGGAFAQGQGQPSPERAPYKAPRTSFGDPDLQGLWTNASVTTLERLPGATALVATPQEAAALETSVTYWSRTDGRPTNPNAGPPPAGQDVGGYNAFWIDLGAKLGVVKGEARTSWIVDPPSGRIPYTEDGRKRMTQSATTQRRNFDGPEARSLGERCIVGYGSSGGPPMLNVLYNNNYQIVQSPGFVVIVVEMNHDARIIRLGGSHLPQAVRPWMGDSVGRWEGDTLVVETTNFNSGHGFTADIRHRLYIPPNAKVTERFTRLAKDEIFYEFKVEEPSTYTQPWRGEVAMRATAGPIYEYACHEGNYSMPNILGGARLQEKNAKAPTRSP